MSMSMSEDAAQQSWQEFLDAPNDKLTLTQGRLAVDPPTIRYFVEQIKSSKSTDSKQPSHLVLANANIEVSEATASHLVELLGCCENSLTTLRFLHISNDGIALLPSANQVYETVLQGAPSVLPHFSCLEFMGCLDGAPNLVKPFTMEACHIQNLHIGIYGQSNYDQLVDILQGYDGLKTLVVSNCNPIVRIPGPAHDDQLRVFFQAIENSPCNLSRLFLRSMHLYNRHLPLLSSIVKGQKHLQVLNLSGNRLFQRRLADGSYEYDNEHTRHFFNAVAKNGSLQELDLGGSRFTTETMGVIFPALTRSSSLEKLAFSPVKDVTIESAWVKCLPRLQKLRLIVGMQAVAFQVPQCSVEKGWDSLVIPALRQNTSLEKLPGLHDGEAPSKPGTECTLFHETNQILARNKVMRQVKEGCCGGRNALLSISVWPRLLERCASRAMDASALFGFLQSRVGELPDATKQQVVHSTSR